MVREFLARGDFAVFGFQFVGDTESELKGDGIGLIAAGFTAGRNDDVSVENDAHGNIVFG